MVESLKELNQICQKPRYKEVGNWMVRHLERKAALPITWLLLHTSVTANQVTLVSLVFGLAGIGLFVFHSDVLFLVGTGFLQLWYLLDHVDGQIARYRRSACLTGRFFDFLAHHIIHGVIFFSLGLYSYRKSGNFFVVIWGFMTALSMMLFNLLNDTKCKTFFEALVNFDSVRILPPAKSSEPPLASSSSSVLRKAFSFLHKMCEIHVLMNVLTVSALSRFFVRGPFDGRMILAVLYGLIVPVIAVVKSVYLIRTRKIDDEFRNTFHQIDFPH